MSGRILLLVLALVVLTAYQSINSQTAGSFNGFDLDDQMGNIRKPADVRDLYQLLGTYTVFEPTSMVALGSKSESDEMHITYASPGTAEYYRKNGKFADGTVLVKEVLGTDQARLTTGNAHWAKGVKQWFVMIKDEKIGIRKTHCGVMDGDGRSSNPMHPKSKWRLITRKIAWAVTFPPAQLIGFMSMVIRFSQQSKPWKRSTATSKPF
jgi:hypothetical protein